jgi:secreted PhoX family phosphatase
MNAITRPEQRALDQDSEDCNRSGNPTKFLSHWPGNAGYGPGGANARPRSATIVITRNDGGLIGVDGTATLNGY